MRSILAKLAAVLGLAAASSCATADPPLPRAPVTRADPPPPVHGQAADEDYYVPVEAPIGVVVTPAELPLDDAQFVRLDGAEPRWAALPPAARDALRKIGFAVVADATQPTRTRLGDYFVALRDARVPYLVTMDALVAIAHLALDRMFAEAEARVLVPSLAQLLPRLVARLMAERLSVGIDLRGAYDLALGLVVVANALVEPAAPVPADLAPVVAQELRRIDAHADFVESPLLRAHVDYTQMALAGALAVEDRLSGSYRAMAWLGAAGLALASRYEEGGGAGDVAFARTRTRAALLLARLVQPDVEPAAAAAWSAVARPVTLLAGPADDLTPRELAEISRQAKLDVRSAEAIANVVRVDAVRRAARVARPPVIEDGPPGPSVRLFGSSASPDAEALQQLVAPRVKGRNMPLGLDVAAWLGAKEAPALVRAAAPETPPQYDDAILARVRRPLSEAERHGSLLATGLSALRAYVAPSRADGVLAAASGNAWQRHRAEVAISGWLTFRHDATAFIRVAEQGSPSPIVTPSRAPIAFVEPHPEAIAELVAMVEQAERGLVALGAIPAPADTSIARGAMLLLRSCLDASLHEANDEPIEGELARTLAEMPARLADLEARLVSARASERPISVVVHADRVTSNVLVEGIGGIDDLYAVVREPRTGRLVLAVGPRLATYEWTQPAKAPRTDTVWQTRLAKGRAPSPASWVAPFVFTPAADK